MGKSFGGHSFKSTVNGISREKLIDKRLKKQHQNRRTNIGKVRYSKDLKYDKYLLCVSCGEFLPRKMFKNHSILAKDRSKIGFNVTCENCNKNKYENGYKLDEFVVEDESSEKYEVERIVGKMTKKNEILYKVKWSGYSMDECTWEPFSNLVEDGVIKEIEKFECLPKLHELIDFE